MRFLNVPRVAVLMLVLAAPAAAQVQSRPTDPPIVSAENDSWFRLGEPLQFAGGVYFRAGATVFFNGNTMVRTGHYNGVPLYADTTIEPYSIVYVPIGRGLMQPYERLRTGDLAGTSGSRTPSFPSVRVAPGGSVIPNAAAAPTDAPRPIGAISAYTPEVNAVGTAGRVVPEVTIGRADDTARRTVARPALQPKGDGVFVTYRGQKWISAGPVVPLRESEFVRSGDYAGFPVYTRRDAQDDVIYLPSTSNQVAPFRLKRELTPGRP
jgi:hypothetical protein